MLCVPERGRALSAYAKRLIEGLQEKAAAVPRDEQVARVLAEPGVAPR